MDSPWSGVEFYFASHLIYEKMVKEGEEVLKGIYDRYKVAGNFWNHLEWGSHYLRPLSSITIIAAYEGIRYDGFTKTLTIDPAVGELEWILLLPTCWGRIKVNENIINIKIYHGKLDIIRLILPKIPREIRINNMKIDYEVKENEIVLNREILLGENEIMELSF